jgi:alanyl-tRNA synthetase
MRNSSRFKGFYYPLLMATPSEIRHSFQDYMSERGFNVIPRDKLISPTFSTCYTLSGGPNFVDRYLRSGSVLPENSVVIQPCHRFWDAENVGDGKHLSFFEMGVTSSFNGITREEMFRHHIGFLTGELGLNPAYFTVSVFGGGNCYDTHFVPDEIALKIWKSLGISRFSVHEGFGKSPHHKRLVNEAFVMNTVEPVGGPRTEIYYGDLEIWTSVLYNTFVEYDRETNSFNFDPISDSTLAAGFGLERAAMAANGMKSIDQIYQFAHTGNPVVKDHMRGLLFLNADGAFELKGDRNSGRKTLLNRYVANLMRQFHGPPEDLRHLSNEAAALYSSDYPEISESYAFLADKIEKRAGRLK